jgi:cyclopropane fatty-acyl-phospholipid synthase-like methyltransferase
MDFKQQLVKAYDKDAKRRDKAEGKREQWKLDVREQFVKLLKSNNKKSVLELGSGAGLDAKYLQDNGFDVLATDLSNEMVKMCRKRGLKAKAIDLYNLTSLKRTFDGIFSMNVLLHVPKKHLNGVLTTISNTLNDNGIFFYGVYGGIDKEEIFTDKSKMGLPRFFSFLSDETLLNTVQSKFEVLDFQTIDIGSDKQNFHFQALFLKKM